MDEDISGRSLFAFQFILVFLSLKLETNVECYICGTEYLMVQFGQKSGITYLSALATLDRFLVI